MSKVKITQWHPREQTNPTYVLIVYNRMAFKLMEVMCSWFSGTCTIIKIMVTPCLLYNECLIECCPLNISHVWCIMLSEKPVYSGVCAKQCVIKNQLCYSTTIYCVQISY